MKPTFSIIIPAHNKHELTEQCLDSFFKHHGHKADTEIIVVDDASNRSEQDKLIKIVDKYYEDHIQVLWMENNVGFPSAANNGLLRAEGMYKILVNNDIIFTENILTQTKKRFESDPTIASIGYKLYFEDGSIQHGGTVSPKPFVFWHVIDPEKASKSRYSLSITGALWAFSELALADIGHLDQKFFISCDDSEWCLRAWDDGWRVFYEAEVSAIHLEGATRGKNTPEDNAKRPQWLIQKENEAWEHYMDLTRKYSWDRLVKEVRRLNFFISKQPTKIELGGGNNPVHGYFNIDVISSDKVDLVCDFSCEKIPFPDRTVEEVIMNHSIEHISFRKIPFLLTELRRIMKPGATLTIRTPSLKFICETYLADLKTSEAKQDEDFVEQNFGEVTSSWWANIKLFAGQDYPSNFHTLCFDFPMLKSALERYGFTDVKEIDIQPVYSPGELQVQATKSVEKPTVLVNRTGAMGDVILTTPILKKLSEFYRVFFQSDYEKLMYGLPYIEVGARPLSFDRFINLDMAYENNPKVHIIDAYRSACGIEADMSKYPMELAATRDAVVKSKKIQESYGLKDYIVIHPAVSWENRTIPRAFWTEFAGYINKSGIKVISVGSNNDFYIENTIPMLNALTISEVRQLIQDSAAFIGPDSGLYHVASTTNVLQFGLFTCALPEFRAPLHKETFNYLANVPCVGCHHEKKAPVTFSECEIAEKNKCVKSFDPFFLSRAVIELLHSQGRLSQR